MRALLIASLVFFAGCLNGDYNADASAAPPDMSSSVPMFDLAGYDLFGLYNCTGLNQCEQKCTTKACVFMCRTMATPTAVQLELNLQNCFGQYCPTGAGQVCAPDMTGMLTMACMTCIANTYVAQGQSCTSTQFPDECHMCLSQANACSADQ